MTGSLSPPVAIFLDGSILQHKRPRTPGADTSAVRSMGRQHALRTRRCGYSLPQAFIMHERELTPTVVPRLPTPHPGSRRASGRGRQDRFSFLPVPGQLESTADELTAKIGTEERRGIFQPCSEPADPGRNIKPLHPKPKDNCMEKLPTRTIPATPTEARERREAVECSV